MSLPSKFRGSPGLRRSGVIVALYTATPDFDFEVQRAPEVAGAPDTNAANYLTVGQDIPGWREVYIDTLPIDGLARWYRLRHTRTGYTPSGWTGWVRATPVSLVGGTPSRPPLGIDPVTGRVSMSVAMVDAGGAAPGYPALSTTTNGTTLPASVVVTREAGSGSVVRVARNGQEGTCRHNVALTYAKLFAGTPMTNLRGGAIHQPDPKWGTASEVDAGTAAGAYVSARTYDELVALNAGPGGFTPRLRLRQKGAPTAQAYNFSGTAISSIGGTDSSAALAAGASANDQYRVRGRVAITTEAATAGSRVERRVTVIVEALPDGVTPYERYRETFISGSNTGAPVEEVFIIDQTLAQSGVTTAGKWRIKVIDSVQVGTGTTSFAVRGFTATLDGAGNEGVTYSTSGTDKYASKTPDTTDTCYWNSVEVS